MTSSQELKLDYVSIYLPVWGNLCPKPKSWEHFVTAKKKKNPKEIFVYMSKACLNLNNFEQYSQWKIQ